MKIRLVLSCIIICALPLVFHSSFLGSPQEKIVTYEPTKDFSFLKRFYCISDLFGKDQWENNKGRSFNEEGVHLTNLKKHPVNACHYALFCYDEYYTSKDETFKIAFLAQVKYLLDSNSYHVVDKGMIAYPYDIKFHDLNPPWYSALAQSEAISVLIRYYAMTRDKAALDVIVQLRNFMVSPQEGVCGTKSITPEGHAWYEEYPNSKQEKQVLNGFLLTIISLYEYSNLFPDDTTSARLYRESIITVKESFKFYDTGSWLKYNRGDQRQVSNGYMKWQVLEMKLLYAITGDIYFKDLMMLVASYCYNKEYESAGVKLKNYDFSVPLTSTSNKELIFEGKNSQIALNSEILKFTSTYTAPTVEFAKMYDSNLNTFTTLKLNDSLFSGDPNLNFDFKKLQKISSFSITYASLDSLDKPVITLYFKDTITNEKWNKIKVIDLKSEVKTNTYKFQPVKAQVFRIVFERNKKMPVFKVSNLACYPPKEKVSSDFMHYITTEEKGSPKGIALSIEQKGMKDVVVFHKSAADVKSLNGEKWNPLKTYRKFPVKISTDTTMFHKFLIICEPKDPASSIGNLNIQPL